MDCSDGKWMDDIPTGEIVTRSLIAFILKYRWIWDGQVTKFFAEEWWTRMPAEWNEALAELTVEKLNNLPFDKQEEHLPETLKEFLSSSVQLSLPRLPLSHILQSQVVLNKDVARGMTPKKLHEVSLIAGVIRDVCRATCCGVVVDIGAGLGYLGDCLSRQCGLVVVCLEKEGSRVLASQKRAQASKRSEYKNADTSRDKVSLSGACQEEQGRSWQDRLQQELPRVLDASCKISLGLNIEDSDATRSKLSVLVDSIKAHLGVGVSPDVCLVGLHCCGDLSDAVLKTFTSQTHTNLKSLVLLGCCYHKTEHAQWRPISQEVTSLLHSCHHASCCLDTPTPPVAFSSGGRGQDGSGCGTISKYGLRLAAQETKERWKVQSAEEHRGHMIDVGYRGMLEAVCPGDQLPRQQLRKIKPTNFKDYAKAIASHLTGCGDIEDKLLQYYRSHESYLNHIQPFTALQVCMQGPLESLVLLDRLAYLQESGYPQAKLLPVFDPLISPRNMALVATPPALQLTS